MRVDVFVFWLLQSHGELIHKCFQRTSTLGAVQLNAGLGNRHERAIAFQLPQVFFHPRVMNMR